MATMPAVVPVRSRQERDAPIVGTAIPDDKLEEKEEAPEQGSVGPPPDGGRKAWLVLLVC